MNPLLLPSDELTPAPSVTPMLGDGGKAHAITNESIRVQLCLETTTPNDTKTMTSSTTDRCEAQH